MPRTEPTSWALIAHGGAKDIAPQEDQQNRDGLYRAVYMGSQILSGGGTALDAVQTVVQILENDPTYNAGLYGSVTNEEDEVELTASIMDGATLDIGAVACIREVENPILVARELLRDKAILLVGEGAKKFARSRGIPAPTPSDSAATPGAASLAAGRHDTVGCVARDLHGNLAAATSTGGLTGVRTGRVGDVPLPGCGFYADNRRGAVSASGEGEAIARVLLASEFLHFLETMPPEEAAEHTIHQLNRVHGEAGLIALTPEGRIGWAHNTDYFAVGMAWEDYGPSVFLSKHEEMEER